MGERTTISWSVEISSIVRAIEARVANPLFRSVLQSRVHWVVSGWLVLVSYAGRRSGRRYTFPVAYHRLDEAIVVVTPKRESNWWRNFQESRECRVWLRGNAYTATGKLVTTDERASLIAAYFETYGVLGRILAVEPDPTANANREPEPNHDLAVVRFVLDDRC